MSIEKRICTHPRRESRRSRARLLQERMLIETNEGNGPSPRAALRGYRHAARSEWPTGHVAHYRRASAGAR